MRFMAGHVRQAVDHDHEHQRIERFAGAKTRH